MLGGPLALSSIYEQGFANRDFYDGSHVSHFSKVTKNMNEETFVG